MKHRRNTITQKTLLSFSLIHVQNTYIYNMHENNEWLKILWIKHVLLHTHKELQVLRSVKDKIQVEDILGHTL